MNKDESGTHAHHHHHHHEGAAGIRQAFFLNLFFTIIEIAGGLWTNSMAILADAIHDLGDSFALGSAWYFERLSGKAGDEYYSYGYRRFSLLGALINIVILVIGSFFILSHAIPRLFNPEPSHAPGMIGFALLGILVNGVAALRLKGKEGMNVSMVAWHLLEDVLGWFAILVTGLVLLFWEIHMLDALLSILITGYVLFNVLRNLKTTMAIFLQGIPGNVSLPVIEGDIGRLDGVASIHHAHVWTLDGHDHILTMHVILKGEFDKERTLCLKESIRGIMASHGITHSTVEFEYEGEECRISGRNCRNGSPNGSCAC
jgi:cobalt-zinc-cadmium efflux system protein